MRVRERSEETADAHPYAAVVTVFAEVAARCDGTRPTILALVVAPAGARVEAAAGGGGGWGGRWNQRRREWGRRDLRRRRRRDRDRVAALGQMSTVSDGGEISRGEVALGGVQVASIVDKRPARILKRIAVIVRIAGVGQHSSRT